MIVQPDGKVVIGGDFLSVNGQPRARIARLLDNGDLDTSFIVGEGLNGDVRGLALQADGRILAVGSFTTYDGLPAAHMVCLNTNGSLDTNFSIPAGPSEALNAVAVFPDGSIIIGGRHPWGIQKLTSIDRKSVV